MIRSSGTKNNHTNHSNHNHENHTHHGSGSSSSGSSLIQGLKRLANQSSSSASVATAPGSNGLRIDTSSISSPKKVVVPSRVTNANDLVPLNKPPAHRSSHDQHSRTPSQHSNGSKYTYSKRMSSSTAGGNASVTSSSTTPMAAPSASGQLSRQQSNYSHLTAQSSAGSVVSQGSASNLSKYSRPDGKIGLEMPPDQQEVESLFEDIMYKRNIMQTLPPEKQQEIRDYDIDKKWLLVKLELNNDLKKKAAGKSASISQNSVNGTDLNSPRSSTENSSDISSVGARRMKTSGSSKSLSLGTHIYSNSNANSSAITFNTEKTNRPPIYYVKKILADDLTKDELNDLWVTLRTEQLDWVDAFLGHQGHIAMANILMKTIYKTGQGTKLTEKALEKEASYFKCFRVLIMLSQGLYEFTKHHIMAETVGYGLFSTRLPTRKMATEIFVCMLDKKNKLRFNVILGTLDKKFVIGENMHMVQYVKNSPQQFVHLRKDSQIKIVQAWLTGLENTLQGRGKMGSLVGASEEFRAPGGENSVLEYSQWTMVFMNHLCMGTNVVNQRVLLRTRLENAGALRIMNRFKLLGYDKISTQIEYYENGKLDDINNLLESEGQNSKINMQDPMMMLQKLWDYCKGTENEQSFTSLIQHLFLSSSKLVKEKADPTRLAKQLKLMDSLIANVSISTIDEESSVNVAIQRLYDAMQTDEVARRAILESRQLSKELEEMQAEREFLRQKLNSTGDGIVGRLEDELKERDDILAKNQRVNRHLQTELEELKKKHLLEKHEHEVELRKMLTILNARPDDENLTKTIRSKKNPSTLDPGKQNSIQKALQDGLQRTRKDLSVDSKRFGLTVQPNKRLRMLRMKMEGIEQQARELEMTNFADYEEKRLEEPVQVKPDRQASVTKLSQLRKQLADIQRETNEVTKFNVEQRVKELFNQKKLTALKRLKELETTYKGFGIEFNADEIFEDENGKADWHKTEIDGHDLEEAQKKMDQMDRITSQLTAMKEKLELQKKEKEDTLSAESSSEDEDHKTEKNTDSANKSSRQSFSSAAGSFLETLSQKYGAGQNTNVSNSPVSNIGRRSSNHRTSFVDRMKRSNATPYFDELTRKVARAPSLNDPFSPAGSEHAAADDDTSLAPSPSVSKSVDNTNFKNKISASSPQSSKSDKNDVGHDRSSDVVSSGITPGKAVSSGTTIAGSTVATSTASTSTVPDGTVVGSTVANNKFSDGTVAGGTVAGGTVAGGTVAGGTVAGGTVASGAVAGGAVAGGAVAGGAVAGGAVAGGAVAGGVVAGSTVAGSTVGGSTVGGSTVGGSTVGGSTVGGSTVAGGAVAGGAVAGGAVAGGAVAGSTVGGGTVGRSAVASNAGTGGTVAGSGVAGGTVSGDAVVGDAVVGDAVVGDAVAVAGAPVTGATVKADTVACATGDATESKTRGAAPAPPPPPPPPPPPLPGMLSQSSNTSGSAPPPPPPPPPPASIFGQSSMKNSSLVSRPHLQVALESSDSISPSPPPPAPAFPSGERRMYRTDTQTYLEDTSSFRDNYPQPRKKLKQLHWEKLDSTEDSIWSSGIAEKFAGDLYEKGVLAGLEKAFAAREIKSLATKKAEDLKKISFLSHDISQQFGINLHMYSHLSVSELVVKILKCERDFMHTPSAIEFLSKSEITEVSVNLARNFSPYSTDWDSVKSLEDAKHPEKDPNDLQREDQIYLQLIFNLQAYWGSRMRAIRVITSYEKEYQELVTKLRKVDKAVGAILKSENLSNIFNVILAVGNFMNDTAKRAQGFKLSTLQRLTFIKDTTNSMTFLNYVEKIIRENYPSFNDFLQELEPVMDVTKISIDQLVNDCREYSQGVTNVERSIEIGNLSDSSKFHPLDRVLIKVLPVLPEARKKCDLLDDEVRLSIMEFENLIHKYGEDSSDKFAKNSFFRKFADFIQEYKKAQNQNLKAEEEERIYERHKKMVEEQQRAEQLASKDQTSDINEEGAEEGGEDRRAMMDKLLDQLKNAGPSTTDPSSARKRAMVRKRLLADKDATAHLLGNIDNNEESIVYSPESPKDQPSSHGDEVSPSTRRISNPMTKSPLADVGSLTKGLTDENNPKDEEQISDKAKNLLMELSGNETPTKREHLLNGHKEKLRARRRRAHVRGDSSSNNKLTFMDDETPPVTPTDLEFYREVSASSHSVLRGTPGSTLSISSDNINKSTTLTPNHPELRPSDDRNLNTGDATSGKDPQRGTPISPAISESSARDDSKEEYASPKDTPTDLVPPQKLTQEGEDKK